MLKQKEVYFLGGGVIQACLSKVNDAAWLVCTSFFLSPQCKKRHQLIRMEAITTYSVNSLPMSMSRAADALSYCAYADDDDGTL